MSISLFDALTTAPMLSAYLIGKIKKDSDYTGLGAVIHAPAAMFGKFQDWLTVFYERVMHFTLRHKLGVLFAALLIFFGSLTLTKGIPVTFMPNNEWGEFMVYLEAAPGTSLDKMTYYAKMADSMIRKEKDIETVLVTVGNSNGESNTASLFVRMVDTSKRSRSTSDMKEYVRKMLMPYKDILLPQIGDITMSGANESPFFLLIKGDDTEKVSAVANSIVPKLSVIRGLVDIQTNYRPGKPEFQVQMDPKKLQKLGVLSILAGMELRGMVEGNTPAKYREENQEYDIRVRLDEPQRDLEKDFNELYVPNVNNQLIRVKNVAESLVTTGPSKIFRRDRSRYVAITGNLDKNGAIGNITADAKKILMKEKFPEGITYEFHGSSEDFQDLMTNMMIAAGLSVIFIYLVLASLYESILVPFTIMVALPLAIVGGLVALYIGGQTISLFTMIGFIMLLGLTTKNSILLVDLTQKLECTGITQEEALIKAGITRLRPILMTTFALIAGMMPLAMGLTEVGKSRQSMGVAIIGGLVSSTVLTLVVVPAVYGYVDIFRLWMRRIFHRPKDRTIDCKGDKMV